MWIVRLHIGSALRLSRPLSGFLADPSFVALFRATTVPGILPSELFPHEDRAPLSGPLAPLQLSTDVPGRAERRRSPPVSPTSTLSRGCLDPPTTMDSLSVHRGALPGRPELRPTEPPCSASFTYFEAFFPSRDRTSSLGSPRSHRPLLSGFCPFEAFSSHASDPRPARP